MKVDINEIIQSVKIEASHIQTGASLEEILEEYVQSFSTLISEFKSNTTNDYREEIKQLNDQLAKRGNKFSFDDQLATETFRQINTLSG